MQAKPGFRLFRVSLSNAEHEAFRQAAERQGVSMATFVRQAIVRQSVLIHAKAESKSRK